MAEQGEQRRLAAIVAADMVGYSRLMEADESGTIARQKAHRTELIDPKIACAAAHLAAHQVAKQSWPEQLELVDAMPLTPTNKVIKGQLAPKAKA